MQYAPFNRSAVFQPQRLKSLENVFDNAWAAIAENFSDNLREAARVKLATIILELAADGGEDLIEIKCRAIGAMRLPRAA